MAKWQPIETAPKWISVLTFDTDGDILLSWAGEDGFWTGNDGASEYCDFTPTHWMPLPEPPL